MRTDLTFMFWIFINLNVIVLLCYPPLIFLYFYVNMNSKRATIKNRRLVMAIRITYEFVKKCSCFLILFSVAGVKLFNK